MARARLLLLVPLLCVLTSCGAGETGPAPERPDDWAFRPRRYCPVNLPEATHARWDRDALEHPLVCLTAGGDVSFERGHWSLATARDAERQNELALFEATLGHHGHAAPRPTLQFQFDADARWTYVAALLRIAARVPGLDDRVLWNVASSATWRPVHQAVRILPLSEGSRDLPTVEIRARPPLDGDRWRVEMELTAGGESVITIEEDYESEERAATRAAWDAAAARWGTWIGQSRGVRLVIVDEARGDARRFVPWSHVARVLDLLWGHDVRTVDLPGLGFDFELIPPEALHNDPFVYPDDPIASPLGWLLAAVAAVLAFVLTFAGAWRSRRVRPRRSRAS